MKTAFTAIQLPNCFFFQLHMSTDCCDSPRSIQVQPIFRTVGNDVRLVSANVHCMKLQAQILLRRFRRTRSPGGPACLLTDDSRSDRNAFSAVRLEARFLLCIFHVLQAVWRRLFDQKNGIRHEVL